MSEQANNNAASAANQSSANATLDSSSKQNSENADLSQELSSESEQEDSSEVKTKEEVKKEIKLKKLKLKVDGKDYEEEFNPDDDEYLTRQLQMAKMGGKRAQEKAQLEKEINEFINELRTNPRKILQSKELGLNFDKVIEEYINEQLENAKKTPEQVQREKLENELKAIKEEREREKEEGTQRELERLQEQEFDRYDLLMTKALEKSDVPKSPYVVKKMADYMLLGLQQGHDVTPEDVLPLVRDEIHAEIQEMFAVMPEEVIEKILGDGVVNKLRKRRIAKAQNAPAATLKSAVQDTGKSKSEDKAKEKTSYKDFFKFS